MAMPGAFGALSPDALDLVLRHIAEEMRKGILKLVAAFEAGNATMNIESIPSYAGIPGADVRTKADTLSQTVFMRLYELMLKGLGVRGEEYGLRIPCNFRAQQVVITVDPLDGTARFKQLMDDLTLPRGGVSIMLSVRMNNNVIAAYVLDVFTGEMYRIAPWGRHILLTVGDGEMQVLPTFPAKANLADSALILHRSPEHHEVLMDLIRGSGASGAFGAIEQFYGSVGLSVMQIALGRVAAVARRPGNHSTPWDDSPLVAICRAAEIRTFRPEPDGLHEIIVNAPAEETVPHPHGILYVAGHHVPELSERIPVFALP